ncbi:IS4 family transposase [Endozoicomonas arenosclerae]|uniref:IS4 family transposase n=1 Tax=Endozoicomonas arenosclerae TaxID=1633495 RepID=UPI000781E2CD|nr:IS4 family transposase [Endozoicomonas arenosclerae]
MEDVSSLAKELKAHLPWHQARIIFIAQFVLSLIRGRSTNLYRVAEEFQSQSHAESSYRRIKRFFAGYTYCYEQLAKLILHWLNLNTYSLSMDRTNWQFGSKHINYLVVAIAWQGASIPIVWICLDKSGGNSNADERIAIMERVLKLIPAEKIDGLLADREFIGQEWFKWLDEQNITCRLRIRDNIPVLGKCGKDIKAAQLFRDVKLNQTVTWHSKRRVSGVDLYIGATRTLKGLLIVVATKKPETMIKDYYRRWAIETLFGCLKSRGFDLESTHMTDLKRMDKLMGMLALAFAWCLIIGHWQYGEARELPLNKHGRPAKSLFRLGLDSLRRVLKNSCSKNDQVDFLTMLQVLSRT